MPDHFAAIGYEVRKPKDLNVLLRKAISAGRQVPTPRGLYVVWSPGEGIELWFSFDQSKQALGIEPYFAGEGRAVLGLAKLERGPPAYALLEGGVHGWANPPPGDPLQGDCPYVVDLADFDLWADRLRPRQVLTLRIAAFAHDLECFRSDAEFKASGRTARFSPEFFIPSGTFMPAAVPGAPPRQPSATAMFAGHVLRARPVTNPATGRTFRHLLVRTLIGTVDVVADPAIVKGLPVLGGVVRGSFWLSGRIVGEPDLPPRPPPPPPPPNG